jgi:hypothetical protein
MVKFIFRPGADEVGFFYTNYRDSHELKMI